MWGYLAPVPSTYKALLTSARDIAACRKYQLFRCSSSHFADCDRSPVAAVLGGLWRQQVFCGTCKPGPVLRAGTSRGPDQNETSPTQDAHCAHEPQTRQRLKINEIILRFMGRIAYLDAILLPITFANPCCQGKIRGMASVFPQNSSWSGPKRCGLSSGPGLIFLVCLALVTARAGEKMRMENRFLAVEVSVRDGAIVSLSNKLARVELISRLADKHQPWLMLLDHLQFLGEFDGFALKQLNHPDREELSLRWTTKYGIVVHGELALGKESNRLTLRSRAENGGERTILALNYPRLEGIGPLEENGSKDRLLHAALGGVLVRDPFHLFDADARHPRGKGFLPCRYPNAFAGAPLQLMAYYTEAMGGFALRVEDAAGADKDLNFFKAPGNRSLLWEIAHFQGDARPGRSLEVGYPVVITAMTEGSWYEAAEGYRDWATQQVWCKRGTRRQRLDRGDAAAWLFDTIGAVGMWWPFETDIREEVELTRQAMDAPILQFLLRWTDAPSVEAARAGGGRLGPFAFPFVALEGTATFLNHAADALVPRVTPVIKQWIGMCPAQTEWRKVFVEENLDLAGVGPLRHHLVWNDQNHKGCEADALYYDVGPCAGLPTHCYAPEHEHPPGAGARITQAYVSLIKEAQAAVGRRRGHYIPLGTECASEPFLDCLDLYYVRTAGLDPWMECLPYTRSLTWLPDGRMEIVPLWEFVYHEYGPLGMQGIYAADPWTVREGDDYYCWAEARTTLQGQLVVIQPLRPGVQVPAERLRFLRNMKDAEYSVDIVRASERRKAGTVRESLDLEVELPPREFVLVEVR
jgi:Domain of unknown function (DUF6259)